MSERLSLNMTTAELEVLARIASAQRELHTIADELIRARSSKIETRHEQGRKLNAVAASLRSVELALGGEGGT